jgi:hypothetical protein
LCGRTQTTDGLDGGEAVTDEGRVPVGIDVRTPHAARVYDYALGGKDNYAADRALIEKLRPIIPDTPLVARENRAFLGRAVQVLAQAGIRQFIDIGSGLPTQGNVHEVAQQVAPDARVVYVDYDPIVIAHSRELLSGANNATIIQGDVRHPDEILEHPKLRKLIDLDEPFGLLLVGLLHLVADDDDPAARVSEFKDAMTPGSYLALCHITGDNQPPAAVRQWIEVFGGMAEPMVPRPYGEILRFFDGLELLDPGLVKASEWRPRTSSLIQSPATGWLFAGVARKP